MTVFERGLADWRALHIQAENDCMGDYADGHVMCDRAGNCEGSSVAGRDV